MMTQRVITIETKNPTLSSGVCLDFIV